MSNLRWLHLSDFHVGKDNYGQRRMFQAILEHIRLRAGLGVAPTFVFITGDIANSGQTSEYEEFAEEFVTPLSALLGASSDRRIYCVPGNHDVDRGRAPLVSREVIFRRSPSFLDPTSEAMALRNEILPRFAAFFDTDLTANTPHWLRTDGGTFIDRRKVGDVNVAIVGLNTAWHSQDDKDERELEAGAALLEHAFSAVESADFVIVLGHHPLRWLRENDAAPTRVGRNVPRPRWRPFACRRNGSCGQRARTTRLLHQRGGEPSPPLPYGN